MDKIFIKDIKAFGSIGVYPEERTLGQWFAVNLTIQTDLGPAGKSDRLIDTIDYQQVIEHVQTKIKSTNCHLIEHLAEIILADLLTLNQIERITIHLTKLNPPIPGFDGDVSVELTREKRS